MGERGRWNREISFFTSELDPIFEPHDFLASGHKGGGGRNAILFSPLLCTCTVRRCERRQSRFLKKRRGRRFLPHVA